ncbi:S8/S53 family peptidase [Flavobacterium dauae]|uniref:S8/S53 family peptidase n=1 Tax=Flavobacterium dauae TaxID=1563479 RepID=UPI0013EC75B8|nr:S8/S53 family peptidase [Flavobacterium dauae]WLD23477.1 S8/S53 family peptidase [Flavobacterium dauae]
MFLALLTLSFGYNANAQVEDQPMPDYVRKATNIEFLNNFAKEKEAEFEANYKKAVEIARSQGKPLGGVNEKDGSVSVLKGYDEETGGLIYIKTFGSVKADANMFFNNVAVGSSLQTANAKPLHADNIIGAGMTVGVWDGGAGLTNHQGFAGNRYQPKNNPNGNTNLNKDHAAHVAGTVAANTFGNGDAMGFAYGATVHAYYGLLNDLTSMTVAATSTTNPLYVSNHSYGLNFSGSGAPVSIFGQYNSDARDYDLLMNNAPYYTIVFAAGNDREDNFNPGKGGKDLLSQGGVSKNTVVVAATHGTEDFSGITGATSVIPVGNVWAFMAPYSNYGPTDDYRIKPDIAAKGGVMTNNAATTDPVTSVGIASVVATQVMQGTSMAAPAVTGVFTLWQGYYKTVFNKYMRSASVRALMAHTAREAGPANGPDFMFGWGLIDADKGRQIIDQAEENTAIFEEIDLPQGSHFDYEFTYDGVAPLVATVAWNDPAGTITSQTDLNLKKLVNDLDVRLINLDNNTIYYPWSLVHNPGLTHTSTAIAVRNVDNARDNIEKIEPQNAVAGNYKVEITYKGTLSGGNQNFSIIISGAGGQMPSTEGSVSVASVALESLSVYPNPVNDVLTIQGDLNNLNNGTIDIFDVTGKNVLKSKIVDSQSMNINVSNLKQGMYILTITKDGAKQNYKFIKN